MGKYYHRTFGMAAAPQGYHQGEPLCCGTPPPSDYYVYISMAAECLSA